MIKFDISKCDQCSTCVCICSQGALMMVETLEIDQKICINCGKCVAICAFGALALSD